MGSDRWVNNMDELEAMDPNYSSSVHVRNSDSIDTSDRTSFGGIENIVLTSWSFQVSVCFFILSCWVHPLLRFASLIH